MGWLFFTLLLVCCFRVKADEEPAWAELNELNGELEKVESGLSTDDRLKRIEKLVNLLLENQELLKGDIMSHLEEIDGKLSRCQSTNPSTTGPTTTEQPTTTTTTSVETTSTPMYRDCQDAYTKGQTTSGIYTISPNGTSEVDVYCEMGLENGGWTVFQRRMDGTVDFYRSWKDYKEGFGSAQGEYWIGNDHLHQLTAHNDTQLLVELEYRGETLYASYREFWLLSERLNYTLHVGGYTGGSPPGDSLESRWDNDNHNGMAFSTRDRDNDKRSGLNCANFFGGGWWYNDCYESNLNGRYNEGIYWTTWKQFISLSGTRMMLKTK